MEKIGYRHRILIIDEHPLFREGFRAIVDRDGRFKVVGEAGTGGEGFQMIGKLVPDLVVMEMILPDRDAVQLIRDIRGNFPKILVMILSVYHETEYISQALQAGATGYVVKETDLDAVLKGLTAVIQGDCYLGCRVHRDSVIRRFEYSPANRKISDTPLGCLTPREQEVIRLLVEGIKRKEIAETLCISPKTVENHVWRVMKKLSLNNIFELIRYAVKFGIVDVDLWKREPVTDQLMAQQA